MMMSSFMLAGVSSNVGKTSITMGIMAALCRRGANVVPFKTGPDYIDPMFHTFVTGKKSANLDTYMVDDAVIRTLFYSRLDEAAVGIVEGVMGLYDGRGIENDVGSSAYLSKTLGIPVFLIINGQGMAKSAAAMVKGYVDFDPDVRIAGVIINKIKNESHYKLLKEMIETFTGVPCVGWFPNAPEIAVSSRHLGLIPVDELENLKMQVARAAEMAETYIDLDQMLALSQMVQRPDVTPDPFDAYAGAYEGLTLGYASDKAFNFYYDDNFKALEKLGVRLLPFSPLEDNGLPEGLDGLYIGGGFPEMFGEDLAANTAFKASITDALEAGMPCFAECGGLMYLTKSITMLTGETYQTLGFLDAKTVMTKGLKRFGYVEVSANLGDKTVTTKAHEFHHSLVEEDEGLATCYTIQKGSRQWRCGYRYKNVLAGYPHIHFYSNPEFLLTLLDFVKAHKAGESQ